MHTALSPVAAALSESAAGTQPSGRVIAELFDVIDELSDIIAAENDLLGRGMPAALSEFGDLKNALAESFQDLSAEVMVEHAQALAADPDTARRLVEAGNALKRLTGENLDRLSSAIDASRRRIDAVMAAIKAHDQEHSTYGGKPLSLGGRLVDPSVNYRA